jgi:hypothetical protein
LKRARVVTNRPPAVRVSRMIAWRYARWVAGGVAAVLSRHCVQPWAWIGGGLRIRAVKRMKAMRRLFVLRRG